jgi:hypothetical protein
MKQRKIRNAEGLDREIYRRKLRLKEIESTLGKNMEELPGQVPRMALYAFLGSKQNSAVPGSVPGQLMSMALDNEKLQTSLAGLIDRVAELLGTGLEKLTHLLRDRKKRRDDQEP